MSLGVMIDCSRDAVMTVDKLKDFITILAKFGYDSVQLYTEDTYEIDGEPYFGYMRGRYTQEEIRTLGKFCRKLGGQSTATCYQPVFDGTKFSYTVGVVYNDSNQGQHYVCSYPVCLELGGFVSSGTGANNLFEGTRVYSNL